MFYVPLYVEMLRSRPLLVFWPAALLQAAIWIAVPMLFYSAPPEGLAQLLAIGHEFRFDAGVGPPLAYWLAEIAFRAAGMFGVYVLAQICVVATYWCVFALGRAIVGPTHAAMAVLLMVGISLFTVPSPDFGPPILAMALWAAVLLHYWRAVIERERRSWYALGVAAALLLLTSDAALLLLGALVAFTAVTERGRAALDAIEAWIVALALVPFSVPASHLARRHVAGRFGRRAHPDARTIARRRARRRQHDAVAAAACRAHPRPCRARHPFGAGGRLAAGAREPGAAARAHAGRSVRGDLCEDFRAGAGIAGDDRRRRARAARCRSAARRRSSCCPGSRWSSPPATASSFITSAFSVSPGPDF